MLDTYIVHTRSVNAIIVWLYEQSFLIISAAQCSGNINGMTHFRIWLNHNLQSEYEQSSHTLTKWWNVSNGNWKRQWLNVKARPIPQMEVLIGFAPK